MTERVDSGRVGIWHSLISNAASAQIPSHQAIQNLVTQRRLKLWPILPYAAFNR